MSEPHSSKKTAEPRYKIGDIVNLCRWDATERPAMHMGDCVVLKVYPARSESGWVLNVRSLRGGSTLSGMDQNWFRLSKSEVVANNVEDGE